MMLSERHFPGHSTEEFMTAISGFRRIIGTVAIILLGALTPLAADVPSLDVVKTIKLTGPAGKRLEHMALDAKRDRLFVANAANNSLDLIDLKQGKVLKSVPGQEGIQGVVYLAEGDRVFATLASGLCNIFEGDSLKLLKSHKVAGADNPYHDAKNGIVYVTAADKKLSMIDAKTLNVKGEVNLPSAPASLVVEKGRPRMYVNAHVPRQVHVLDTTKHEVLKKYQLDEAGNYPLALDEPNKRLFVGCRMEPRLVVLDTESGKQLASVPIPHDVDDIFFDAKRKQVYLSCGEGFLMILRETQTNRFEVREKLPTVKMARNCLFDAEGSRLFLSLPGPEVRVYQLRP
jgi:DNA-binding beta-propeller fold protein YncE